MKIEDKENTQKLTEDISFYYDSEEDIVSKIQESIGVNFEDWASQITINEYNTLGKLRKFGKEHPEYRGDILKLKDKIRDIYGNAYMESYSKDVKEDLVPDKSQSAIDAVIKNYGTTDTPYNGPSFILPNGSYLDLSDVINHSDVEYWLDQQGLSIKADYTRRSGSPTLRSLGCIRIDIPKYYIQLPQDNITSAQYSTLKDWIEFAFTEFNVPFIEVMAEGTNPVRYRYEDDVDADYIVDRIRRYYITDHLYETYEDKAEGPYLKEASYGGAFDIRDDQYFTRDDLDELIDYIETELNNKIVKDKVQIVDADMSDNTLHLEISTDKDGFWEEFNEKIDMRKIRVPRDLIKVYGKKAVEHFKDILESDGIEFAL